MPSQALKTWQTSSRRALDEIEAAHASVRRRARGRRFAAQQINQAYVVLLSSQFQRFCRDLHSEAIEFLTGRPEFSPIFVVLTDVLSLGRKLDVGNPNPGNIGSDFARFDMDFWAMVRECDRRNARRQAKLEVLIRWRNAVAHQSFTSAALGGRRELRLTELREWRAACDALAVVFDRVVRIRLTELTGVAPW